MRASRSGSYLRLGRRHQRSRRHRGTEDTENAVRAAAFSLDLSRSVLTVSFLRDTVGTSMIGADEIRSTREDAAGRAAGARLHPARGCGRSSRDRCSCATWSAARRAAPASRAASTAPTTCSRTAAAGAARFAYLDAAGAARARTLVRRYREFRAGLQRLQRVNVELVGLLRRYQQAQVRRDGREARSGCGGTHIMPMSSYVTVHSIK